MTLFGVQTVKNVLSVVRIPLSIFLVLISFLIVSFYDI